MGGKNRKMNRRQVVMIEWAVLIAAALTETEAAVSGPKNSWLFSFAGDCTIGSLPQDFQTVVGDNYSYPFSGVKEIFGADDLTSVNLEGTFTDSTSGAEFQSSERIGIQ